LWRRMVASRTREERTRHHQSPYPLGLLDATLKAHPSLRRSALAAGVGLLMKGAAMSSFLCEPQRA
jgi:hypothetical protein